MQILKVALYTLLVVTLAIAVFLAWYWPRYPYLAASHAPWSAERIGTEPLIAGLAEEHGYNNLCCPALLEVPDWVRDPLGRYYLYFAHHKGSYIRLAYSDNPRGPWSLHEEGVLPLEYSGLSTYLDEKGEGVLQALWHNFELPIIRDFLIMSWRSRVADPAERRARGLSESAHSAPHIASPEVVVDRESKLIVLFYHGFDHRGGQSSRIASSTDGLHFRAIDREIIGVYLRHFQHEDSHYLLGMPGVLYRSDSLLGPYQARGKILFEPDMRHAGLWLEGDTLHVFWSRVGDAPERILLSQVDLSDADWNRWQATEPVEVLRPELDWEGVNMPIQASLRGELDIEARELRDPYVFRDRDGKLYLYYVGGGEKAIGVARLRSRIHK